MTRTPEDARFRPRPGDRYVYDYGAYEEVVEVGEGRVLARIFPRHSPPKDVWTPLFVWSSSVRGAWVPAPVPPTLESPCA